MENSNRLEGRIEQLEDAVRGLLARVQALEAGRGIAAHEEPSAPPVGAAAGAEGEPGRLEGVASLIGRTCLVLGGGFLFRALTEAGTLTAGLSVAIAIAYAFVWLFLADRAAVAGRPMSGTFHALASALIVYPLIFEASTRFGLLSPLAAAALLTVVTALGLGVAWLRSFRVVAWITVIAALGVGVLLMFRTHAVLEFVVFLMLLALASLLLAYVRGWRGQRWLVALTVDGVVAMLGALLLISRGPPEWLPPSTVLVAQLGLVAVYLAAFVLRLLMQERPVTTFAITQTTLVLLVGFEGALWLGPAASKGWIAGGALAVGALLHAVLARGVEQRRGHSATVAYFSSLATFLVAEGVRILLPSFYPAVWALAAVAVATIALSGTRPVLEVHAGVLTVAAVATSGLLRSALAALTAPATSAWPSAGAGAIVVLVLAAGAVALLYRESPPDRVHAFATGARVAALVAVIFALGGVVVTGFAGPLAAAPGPAADAGRVAALRSAVLAAAAVLFALARSVGARRELVRLAGVLLFVGGAKLLFEDLRVGSASALVFSLLLYGSALVAVPALARRGRASGSA